MKGPGDSVWADVAPIRTGLRAEDGTQHGSSPASSPTVPDLPRIPPLLWERAGRRNQPLGGLCCRTCGGTPPVGRHTDPQQSSALLGAWKKSWTSPPKEGWQKPTQGQLLLLHRVLSTQRWQHSVPSSHTAPARVPKASREHLIYN